MVDAIVNCVKFFCMIILFVHFIACFWIFLGSYDNRYGDLPLEDRHTWLAREGNEFEGANWFTIYAFAQYWIITVITTVGYGDVNGETGKEYLFAIMVEFCGLSFFSLLMGVLSPLFKADESF